MNIRFRSPIYRPEPEVITLSVHAFTAEETKRLLAEVRRRLDGPGFGRPIE